MINRVLKLLGGGTASPDSSESDFDPGTVAAAALMVEAATLDGDYGEEEKAVIAELLTERFGLTADEVEALMAEAATAQDETGQLFRFTQSVKETYSLDEKVRLIEMLWEVAYADGVLHDFEANLLRRVAGLIYVPDRDSGAARRRVLTKLGIEG